MVTIMYYYDGFYPFHMFGFLSMALFWGAIIYGILVLFRRQNSGMQKNNRPLEILQERYAKGEITKEQFESIKKDLQ